MRAHNLIVDVFLTISFVFIHSLVAADFSGKIVRVLDGDTIEGQRHPSSHDVPAWGRQKAGGYGWMPLRSQNAHDKAVLVRCAHYGTSHP